MSDLVVCVVVWGCLGCPVTFWTLCFLRVGMVRRSGKRPAGGAAAGGGGVDGGGAGWCGASRAGKVARRDGSGAASAAVDSDGDRLAVG